MTLPCPMQRGYLTKFFRECVANREGRALSCSDPTYEGRVNADFAGHASIHPKVEHVRFNQLVI